MNAKTVAPADSSINDMSCPQCGHEGQFIIAGTAWFAVTHEGSDTFEGLEWHDDSGCVCGVCGFVGKVINFDPKGAT